jgi:hypothetical protein
MAHQCRQVRWRKWSPFDDRLWVVVVRIASNIFERRRILVGQEESRRVIRKDEISCLNKCQLIHCSSNCCLPFRFARRFGCRSPVAGILNYGILKVREYCGICQPRMFNLAAILTILVEVSATAVSKNIRGMVQKRHTGSLPSSTASRLNIVC